MRSVIPYWSRRLTAPFRRKPTQTIATYSMVKTMSETPASSDKTEYNRLWWHSRRGMLELDNLLIPFVEQAYQDLGADDRARYKKLLSCEDNDMFEWFMQRNRPEDPDLQRIVDLILNRVQPD